MRAIRQFLLFALVTALSISSCQCRQDTPPSPVSVAKPAEDVIPATKTVPAATATPEAVAPEPTPTEAVAVPADFPEEMPLYEGSTVMRVHDMANSAHNVILSVQDSVPNISQFYRKTMQDQGFEMTQQFERDKHAFTTFKKGDLLINLTVAEDERSPGQQIIAIMYERETPLPFDEF